MIQQELMELDSAASKKGTTWTLQQQPFGPCIVGILDCSWHDNRLCGDD